MKKIMLAFAFFGFLQSQSNAQTLNPNNAQKLQFNTPKSVSVTKDKSTVSPSVQIVVEVKGNFDDAAFQRISNANRYLVQGRTNEKNFAISMPNLQQSMKIAGKAAEETVSISIKGGKKHQLIGGKTLICSDSNNGQSVACLFDKAIEVEVVFVSTAPAVKKSSATGERVDSKVTPSKGSSKYGDILIDDVPIPFE
jgi:hypothetical protein